MRPETAIRIYADEGDPDAFGVLVDRYGRFVYAVCRRMLTSAESEDAVQDVFLKLMANAHQVQEDIAAWLHRCAVNTCLDIIRSNRARRNRESRYVAEAAWVADESPARQILQEVDEAIAKLDDRDQALVIRYFLDGETQQQLADELSVSQSTIQRRLTTALRKLRRKLNSQGVVASGVAIGAALTSQQAQASVPAEMTRKLATLALAPPKLISARASESVVKLGASKGLGWALGGKATWMVAALLALPIGGWCWLTLTSEREPEIRMVELGAQTIFQHEYDLTGGADPNRLVQDLTDRMRRRGFSADGIPVYLHPEGIGVGEEQTLIVAIPTRLSQEQVEDEHVLVTESHQCVALKARPGRNPFDVIAELESELLAQGYRRTFRDRFVPLDPKQSGGFVFDIFLGIEPRPPWPGMDPKPDG